MIWKKIWLDIKSYFGPEVGCCCILSHTSGHILPVKESSKVMVRANKAKFLLDTKILTLKLSQMQMRKKPGTSYYRDPEMRRTISGFVLYVLVVPIS